MPSQVLKMLLFAYYYTAWMVGSQVGLCEKTLNFQWFFDLVRDEARHGRGLEGLLNRYFK